MTASSLLKNAPQEGLQALDLSLHLGGMAQLIELCFSVGLDPGGRGLIREMQLLSHAGPLLKVLDLLPFAHPYWNQGYVWLEGGKVVGCVSTQRAAPRSTTWLVANVAVHPDHRRRGIALALMRATLDLIHSQGGREVTLQVDDDNVGAVALYQQLGFRRMVTQTTWRRSAQAQLPAHQPSAYDVRLRGPDEWLDQLELARVARPAGLAWNQPLGQDTLRPSFWKTLEAFFDGQAEEHWVAEDPRRGAGYLAPGMEQRARLAGSLIVRLNGPEGDRLTLLVHPNCHGQLERALLVRGLRRLGHRPWPVLVEHPTDDEAATAVLSELEFQPGRILQWLKAEVK